MLKEEVNCGRGGRRARTCDSCRVAACAVYCRADSAYLCTGCDARVHAANPVASRHERVWVDEACEHAPVSVTCKADAAALCHTCDSDIHSANPRARRHHRLPILGCISGPHVGLGILPVGLVEDSGDGFPASKVEEVEDEDEAASWLVFNSAKNDNQSNNGFLYGGEIDEYLDLVGYNSDTENQYHDHYSVMNGASDSVVPAANEEKQKQQQNLQLDMEFEASKVGFTYSASLSNSVSISSMEASIVPDATMTDISNSQTRPPKGSIDLFSGPPLQIPPQFSPMDREARVLRYREKRKSRKFEKTIRYASRKAYAETRPRIKGRFAKRTDVEIEVDQMFSDTIMAESSYGIVPSFEL
ncbi:CONSTANS-like 2 [Tasmannia lanceolata]|uniref:CONSTANS-like 2 n=1 Tax=Tasmannia lanceolata TaxID=3420 RepID=UPI004062A406